MREGGEADEEEGAPIAVYAPVTFIRQGFANNLEINVLEVFYFLSILRFKNELM